MTERDHAKAELDQAANELEAKRSENPNYRGPAIAWFETALALYERACRAE